MRWMIIVLFISGVTLNYITRNSLGIMAPELKSTFNMSNEQYGYITTAFQLAYTLAQPVCGWLIDFIGLKIGFAVCAVLWSVTCIFHSGASSWLHLAILRFFMGTTEAAAAPANTKVMTEWFPKKERTVANGWGGVGFSLGGMLAPPLIYGLHSVFGWQAAFVVPGMLGILWAAVWFKVYAPPRDSTLINPAERDYIVADQDPPPPKSNISLWTSLGGLLRQKRFYGIGLPAFLSEPAWQALGFWVPLYMAQVHGFKLKEIAMFAWLPFLLADLGSLAGGYLTPWISRRFNLSRINAAIVTSASGAVVMVSLVAAAFVDSPYVAVLLISMGGLGHQLVSSMLGVLVMETTPLAQVATANGLRGSFAWIAAAISTLVIGHVTTVWGAAGFTGVFVCLGLFDLIGAVIMISLLWERGRGSPDLIPHTA
ncbi:ACS family hexuronate transporter-like MFS transporter [Silvimonas terrae]|uniref:ACS family hexuronate transporter-like MFS transporter n=1 Tax=Silvimonas terrae TaxID=300266 RepID=A0A840RCN8_9NEIS|nr:MFS transporter [Silvimonas terrae]MBB5191239.1 ACS family hexuronate transporter-like MFS transporter [Silvimonas terrae]